MIVVFVFGSVLASLSRPPALVVLFPSQNEQECSIFYFSILLVQHAIKDEILPEKFARILFIRRGKKK